MLVSTKHFATLVATVASVLCLIGAQFIAPMYLVSAGFICLAIMSYRWIPADDIIDITKL